MLMEIILKWGIQTILESVLACVRVLHSSVWWWRTTFLTTDFHSFLDYWLFSMNALKCCNTESLFEISYTPFKNLEKGLPPLFIKSYSRDKKMLFVKQSVHVSSLHSFPNNNNFLSSISEIRSVIGYFPAYSHTNRTWMIF